MVYAVEQLERRLLLTATANQSGQTLRITGSEGADVIDIRGEGVAGQVGVDLDGNGIFEADEIFSNVSNIFVDTKGGDDSVTVVALELGGNLVIRTGEGNDQVNIGEGVVIGGKLTIRTDDGNDGVQIRQDVNVRGTVSISTDNGDDDVSVFDGVRFGRRTKISTGDGNDDVSVFDDVDLGGSFGLKTGDGDDTFFFFDGANVQRATKILLGDGNDSFNVGSDFFGVGGIVCRLGGRISMSLGSGNDGGNFTDVDIRPGDRVVVKGGAGTDGVGSQLLRDVYDTLDVENFVTIP